MIDTHGLPMKFEFCLGRYVDSPSRKTWIIDFSDTKGGNPVLYASDDRADDTYGWSASEIVINLEDGSWVLLSTFDELPVQVEDLL